MSAQLFSGRVHSIVFENESQAFYILRMVLDAECAGGIPVDGLNIGNGGAVVVRGDVPGLQVGVGTWFGFEGSWTNHPQYGIQLKILRAPVMKKDWDGGMSEKILVSQGVGPAIAGKLRAAFGDGMAEALIDLKKISSVPGMTDFTALHVHNRWQAARAHFLALDFLNDLGLPQGRIRQIWATFGDRAQEILSANPWSLVQIEGVSFHDADAVATRLHLDTSATNVSRIEGAVLHACRSGRGFGHLFSSTGDMLSVVKAIDCDFQDRDIALAIKKLAEEDLLVVERSSQAGLTAIYDPWSYKIEQDSAEILLERFTKARLTPESEATYVRALIGEGEKADTLLEAVNLALNRFSEAGSISLSPAQAQGVRNALCEPVSIISGLPGTGKTTSLRMTVTLLQEAGIPFLVVAPTGIAAKRVASVTGAPAATIHRAFKSKGNSEGSRDSTYAGVTGDGEGGLSGLDGSSEEWGYSPDNPHPAEVVIADESSMVDQHLLYRILNCTREDARLVFVGDAAQLPSVGPGNVLRDLIASKLFPTVALTAIFRQSDTSPIVHAAHAIHRGDVPEAPVGSDFSLSEFSDDEVVADKIVLAAGKLFAARLNFQVLSPRHSGPVGVTTLNARLRELLNPKQSSLREMKIGSEVLREDDRIMVVRNDYKLGVFNGDVGKVVSIYRKDKEVEIKIHGPPVLHIKVPFAKVPSILRLAYAITVHKCVDPDTLVETSAGLLPIREIPDSGIIGTPGGPENYESKVSNSSGSAIRVETKGGYSLVATPDHGIDVWDGEAYVRREVASLRVGDTLRLSLGVKCDATTTPKLPEEPGRGDTREVRPRVPLDMSEDLAEFLGLMVADGSLGRSGFGLFKRHLDVVERFSNLCEGLFGYSVKVKEAKNGWSADVGSTYLSRWLTEIGGMDPEKKGIPSAILRSPERFHRAFLRGLFEDGTVNVDRRRGTAKIDHIEFYSEYPAIVRIVGAMLLRAGIPSSRSGRCVYIYGPHTHTFRDKIGFVSNFKRSRLDLPTGGKEDDFVPLSRKEASELRTLYRRKIPLSRLNNAVNRLKVSLATISECETIESSSVLLQTLLERAKDYHVRVTGLIPTVAESMCVAVPEGNRFIQNGFLAWNSQGQEYDVIIMPVVTSFSHQLQRNLLYTAVTRARKKVILIGTRNALFRAVGNERESARNTLFRERLLEGSESVEA